MVLMVYHWVSGKEAWRRGSMNETLSWLIVKKIFSIKTSCFTSFVVLSLLPLLGTWSSAFGCMNGHGVSIMAGFAQCIWIWIRTNKRVMIWKWEQRSKKQKKLKEWTVEKVIATQGRSSPLWKYPECLLNDVCSKETTRVSTCVSSDCWPWLALLSPHEPKAEHWLNWRKLGEPWLGVHRVKPFRKTPAKEDHYTLCLVGNCINKGSLCFST